MCAETKIDEWIEKRKAQLLKTRHYHVIFTIPHEFANVKKKLSHHARKILSHY
jgi:hypothetical protein